MSQVILKTQKWLEGTVIGLNLCPFAKAVYLKNQIRFTESQAADIEALLMDLIEELKYLSSTDAKITDTSVLIHPNILQDFLDYNDFLEIADAALVELGLESEIQIASFHPNYQFAGTEKDAVENFTNRSPYPMLHFLRVASVTEAIESHPDPEGIPDHNIEKLRNLDEKALEALKALL